MLIKQLSMLNEISLFDYAMKYTHIASGVINIAI